MSQSTVDDQRGPTIMQFVRKTVVMPTEFSDVFDQLIDAMAPPGVNTGRKQRSHSEISRMALAIGAKSLAEHYNVDFEMELDPLPALRQQPAGAKRKRSVSRQGSSE